jgi:ubiquinone/menaquinone biosynthesis C-methylase UbiE
VQPRKAPEAEFDVYSDDYDSHVNRALAFTGANVDLFTKIKTKYLVDFIEAKTRAARQAAVLDVGCGTGNCHEALSATVGRLCGIDVSVSSIEVARARNPQVEYAHYDGASIPYPEGSFDIVFAICVFHHIPLEQRDVLVADIRRSLKPGGYVVVFEHNPNNPVTMRVVNRCEFDRDAILLRSGVCEALLKRGGFNEVDTWFILNVPAINRPLQALDRWLSKFPLGAQYYTAGKK